MKLLNYLVLLVSVLLLVCCGKEENVIIYEAGNQEFGWATGTREGQDWEASSYWRYHLNDSTFRVINFLTYTSFGAERENFSLSEIPLSTGTFTVGGSSTDLGDGLVGGSLSLSTDDGDVGGVSLKVNDDKNSYVTITEINSSTNTMKGFFEIYFIHESGELKVEIKDGEFEARPYE